MGYNGENAGVPNSPLAQFKPALESLAAKLAPVSGIKKVEKDAKLSNARDHFSIPTTYSYVTVLTQKFNFPG